MLSFHLFYHFFRFFALNRNYNISLSNLIHNVSRANPRFVSAKYSHVQNEGISFGTHEYWQFYYLDWRLFAVELHGKSLSSLLWDKSDVGYDLRRNSRYFDASSPFVITISALLWQMASISAPLVESSNFQLLRLYIKEHNRKNHLFCKSVNGAKSSTFIYSIIETAKANVLNVYKYLEFLITELSERKKDGSLDHIDDLLPWAKTPQKECKVPIKKS